MRAATRCRSCDISPVGPLADPEEFPATVPAGSAAFAPAVSPDGASVYVANAGEDAASHGDVGAQRELLSPKTPATVGAG